MAVVRSTHLIYVRYTVWWMWRSWHRQPHCSGSSGTQKSLQCSRIFARTCACVDRVRTRPHPHTEMGPSQLQKIEILLPIRCNFRNLVARYSVNFTSWCETKCRFRIVQPHLFSSLREDRGLTFLAERHNNTFSTSKSA